MSLALDTNVLVRLLTRDDEAQCAAAVNLVLTEVDQGGPAMLSLGVLLEAEWVLRRRYKLPQSEIRQAFIDLSDTQCLPVQTLSTLEKAFKLLEHSTVSVFPHCTTFST